MRDTAVLGKGFITALDGSTVPAEGSFYPAAESAAEAVEGQLVANC